MRITGKRSITGFLKLAVGITLVLNLLVLIALPFLLDLIYSSAGTSEYVENSLWLLNEIPKESYTFMLIFLYVSGVCTMVMLFSLFKVLKNLADNKILEHSNASMFRILFYSCLPLIAAFVFKIIFYNTLLTMFCFFLFILLALFSLIMAEVFRQGATVKEENDLTI